MYIVALDTSTEVLSLAIRDDDRTFLFARAGDLRHAETLMPSILQLAHLAGRQMLSPDLVVCTRGPGSFTGLRIGMATAKGIAAGSGCPVVSVPTLDAFAWGHADFDGAVVPAIDARKGRFYTAVFSSGARLSDDLDVEPRSIARRLEGTKRILVTGTDAAALGNALAPYLDDDQVLHIDARSQAGCAASLLELGTAQWNASGPDADGQGPTYIRESDAELGLKVPG
ncbi:MAG TPA: tRNA (adenosine(37)-N6)-threonylcarbamoyltransferase complex dimerization subunit type 1 TsaB [Spirochaetia bacterium]|nr:tRNA (adenosine(37)-N6)-threonylcarbamoyltransferase complex dimerization subunit type 1 TsaB [Spirochaetia bacterium]